MRWAKSFLKTFGKKPPPVRIARRVPDGTRVYCVGDIHGRDDLLLKMAERVDIDMQDRAFEQVMTVFLGDYVDRGHGSKRVVERLSHNEWPTPFIALAIKLEAPGPAFFGQTRVGENGRRFTCWKFRSMYLDAEERKKELLHLNGGALGVGRGRRGASSSTG